VRLRTDLAAAPARSDKLLVLLPPALASIDDFYTQGFVDSVRQRQLPLDLLLADTSGQQVLDNTVVSALHSQVVLPARRKGYRSIWLAGVSLGAYSALLYAASHATQAASSLAGLCLLSPYPGTNDVLTELRAAGGVIPWSQRHPSREDERNWWHWLAQQSTYAKWNTAVYIGTGSNDRFLRGQALISDLLPKDRIFVTTGAHEWATWKALWDDWLDHGPMHRLAEPGHLQLPSIIQTREDTDADCIHIQNGATRSALPRPQQNALNLIERE
jgi:pimeloyl-ACP methyl ester carboxylesterase